MMEEPADLIYDFESENENNSLSSHFNKKIYNSFESNLNKKPTSIPGESIWQ